MATGVLLDAWCDILQHETGNHPLVVLLSRPGVGKTRLLCALANREHRAGRPVSFLSLEHPPASVQKRGLHPDICSSVVDDAPAAGSEQMARVVGQARAGSLLLIDYLQLVGGPVGAAFGARWEEEMAILTALAAAATTGGTRVVIASQLNGAFDSQEARAAIPQGLRAGMERFPVMVLPEGRFVVPVGR